MFLRVVTLYLECFLWCLLHVLRDRYGYCNLLLVSMCSFSTVQSENQYWLRRKINTDDFFFVLNDWRLLVSWLIFMNRVQSLVKIWFQSHLFVLIWTLNQISIQSLWKLRINSLRYMIYHEFIVIETHVDCSFWLQLSCKIIALLVKNGYVARKCMIRLGTLVFSFQF